MEESEADGEGKDLELDDVAVGRGEGEEHESLDLITNNLEICLVYTHTPIKNCCVKGCTNMFS